MLADSYSTEWKERKEKKPNVTSGRYKTQAVAQVYKIKMTKGSDIEITGKLTILDDGTLMVLDEENLPIIFVAANQWVWAKRVRDE